MTTISERLRREYADFGQRPRGFCNPDGSEAADTIDALVAALEHAVEASDVESDRRVYRAALALARGGK